MGCNESKSRKNKVQPKNQDDITPKIYLNDLSVNSSSNSDIKSTSRTTSELSPRIRSRRPSKASNKPVKPEIEFVGSVVENGRHEQYVDLCEWSPKSDILVTASSDQKVNLWNVQVIHNMNIVELSNASNILALTWSDNGKLFVTGSENGIVSVWTSNGKLMQNWTATHSSGGVKCVKINCNHDLILSGSADEICIYSLKLKKAKLLCWNQSEVTALEWLNKDTFLVGEASGMITMDKISTTEFIELEEYDQEDFIPESDPIYQCQSHIGGIYKILLHPINREISASCSVDCTIKIWNFQGKVPYGDPMTLEGHFGYVTDITWLSTSGKLASASYDGTVKIWDALKAQCLFTLQEGLGFVQCISATKSGLYLASAGHDGIVYFWNTKTGNLVAKYDGPGRIMTASFNSSNNKIAVTSYGSVTLLELSFHHQ